MKLSARNVFAGKVVKVTEGSVNTEVTLDVGGVKIVSIITRESAKTLKLKKGVKAYAVVKASEVLIGVD